MILQRSGRRIQFRHRFLLYILPKIILFGHACFARHSKMFRLMLQWLMTFQPLYNSISAFFVPSGNVQTIYFFLKKTQLINSRILFLYGENETANDRLIIVFDYVKDKHMKHVQ